MEVIMMKRAVWLLVALVAIIALLVACGTDSADEASAGTGSDVESEQPQADSLQPQSEELTVTHELGETTVKKNPETVVVFDFGILDSLDKLGVEVAGVAQDSLPPYLSQYEADPYENIGSLKEPDFEKIAEMEPDLIIISGRQTEVYDQLADIAPTVFMGVDFENYIESFKHNMTTLGEIFDKQSEVEAELQAIDDAINALHEKASASGKNALIVLTTGGKVSAYGPGSRFGFVHDVFGIAAVDENIEASTHGQSISFEYIAEKDPDYLFVIDRDSAIGEGEAAKQVIENDLVKKTKAYQNDNIIYLDPNNWYLSGGGLVSVMEMVKEVDEAIQ